MSKMIDLGYIESYEVASAPKERKPRKEYPTCYVRKTNLPLSPSDVGKTLNIQATIHIVGIQEETNEPNGAQKEYRFELRSMAIDNKRRELRQAIQKSTRR